MKPIDQLGFGPKREEVKQADGNWLLTITPPPQTEFSASSITLTQDQYERYRQWRSGGILIQYALPELSAAQREILMTGIGLREWHEAFKEEDDE